MSVKKSLAPLVGQKTLLQQSGRAKKSAQSISGSRWLAQAEISTYDSGMHSGWKGQYPLLNQTLAAHGANNSIITLTQPQHLLWKSPQFTFQTYVGSQESIQTTFRNGLLPETKTLNLRRGISLVAGKDERPVAATPPKNQMPNRPWISGVASVTVDGIDSNGRDIHDSDAEGLSESLSSAISSSMHRHSSSPINQSRMSPSIGSASPSSFRAATLSFEDAHLISLGNASGSPKQTLFSSMTPQQPHYTQHTFLSTPPAAEYLAKGRYGSMSGPSSGPSSSIAVSSMAAAYSSTSNTATSPLVSSFGESISLNGSGSVAGTSAPGRSLHPMQVHGHISFSNKGSPSSFNGSPNLNLPSKSTHSADDHIDGVSPMAQSTLMMFSPDGDNEVDMPGSASIFIDTGGRHKEMSLNDGSSKRSSQILRRDGGLNGIETENDGGSTLPHGGVFHLDDDFYESDIPVGGDNNQKMMEAMSSDRFDSALERGEAVVSSNREQSDQLVFLDCKELVDDDDDASLI
ncbi:hypothetical protein BCR41DRAFT_207370 [Lobosporangium transversale]|uniref:Uncharacterized protein n=1 Tax=Lobosporangium transversale TaxID=64571 RepID=A0A1Y2G9N0_9FUNG|nr:hypothetical protein BCR41DRAFT_207370 [Lobosporangium transversale]ORZ04070.1 hypothetical protein BCR41DRAFT_207370 [Lobosporangium transversale]|eukprot:XP_021876347.1 hypothetical protein BCR41DRAFT_207370 [Lobosporangium transversale]